jgi:hypothetical protein
MVGGGGALQKGRGTERLGRTGEVRQEWERRKSGGGEGRGRDYFMRRGTKGSIESYFKRQARMGRSRECRRNTEF